MGVRRRINDGGIQHEGRPAAQDQEVWAVKGVPELAARLELARPARVQDHQGELAAEDRVAGNFPTMRLAPHKMTRGRSWLTAETGPPGARELDAQPVPGRDNDLLVGEHKARCRR